MQRIDHIVNLLKDYLTGDLDAQRSDEVEQLFVKHPYLREIVDELDNEEGLQEALHTYKELYSDTFQEREERVLSHVLSQIKHKQTIAGPRLLWKRSAIYSSVAAMLIMTLFATLIWTQKTAELPSSQEIVNSFIPGSNKALLMLSNGKQVDLSDAYSSIVVDDKIAYEGGSTLFDEDSMEEHAMLTLATPRGGQYQVILPDGTKVWLNAESKLYYPYRFSKNIRNVELEGEAYFEVAHQEDAPFIVTTSKEKVEVMGTHFNINSYQADINSTVALLEGKVKVSSGEDAAIVLEPGQQSLLANGKMEVQTINVDESIAWKNGEFMFNNETLESVMKKVARWYDLDIEVSPKLKDVKIWGSVSRYDNFNKVLKLIKMTDERIQFEVEGKRVTFNK